MADGEKSTVQSLLENVRDAGVGFGHRFAPPANVPTELKKLLAELGIADPASSVSNALASAATAWKNIGDALSGVSLNFLDPAALAAGIAQKAKLIHDSIDQMIKAPEAALNGLGASGAAIKAVLPERLLHYIIYEFITKSHEKIGGVFLLLGVLRREFKAAGGNAALVDAEIRVFDLAQLVRVLTHPREAFLTTMRWGTNDFIARPFIDGMVLLLGTIPGTTRGGPDDTFALDDEKAFVGVDPGVRPSALRTLTVPGGTISLVGLHKHGLGLKVPNPIAFGGNLIPAPPLPAAHIFAVTPGAVPASDDPGFKILP